MQAVEVLRAEHEAVLAVLRDLDRAVEAAVRGRPVPADIFVDIRDFFGTFVDRCHHGKEEAAVFPRLGGDGAVVADLEREHREAREFAAEFGEAVRTYVPGDVVAAARLETASWRYGAHLREHIEQETRDLFPAMERLLVAEDARLVQEFDRIEEEEIGAGTHERLHRMVDTLPGRIAPWVAAPAVTP